MRAIMPASAANQLFERSGSSVGQNTGLSRRGSRVRAPSAPPPSPGNRKNRKATLAVVFLCPCLWPVLLPCPHAVLCLHAAFAPIHRLRSGPCRQKPRLHRQHPTRRTLSYPSGTCTVRAAEAQASAPVQARHPSFFCPDNQGVGGTASHNENEGRIATGLEEFKQ